MVSFYLLFTAIVLLVSGVVLYVAPPGRVAYATGWRLLGFDKEQWGAIHTLSGYVGMPFLGAAVPEKENRSEHGR